MMSADIQRLQEPLQFGPASAWYWAEKSQSENWFVIASYDTKNSFKTNQRSCLSAQKA